MTQAFFDLLRLLDLKEVEPDVFQGTSPQVGLVRVFGGLVVSQALVASSRTVTGKSPHSLHCYFLLPGDPKLPIRYEVERLRDGTSFGTRRCVAKQNGRTIFILSASFQIQEVGLDFAPQMPRVAMPEDLPGLDTIRQSLGAALPDGVRRYLERDRPIELRPVDSLRFSPPRPDAPQRTGQRIWLRAKGQLPDDPALHRAILAYMSDMALLDTAAVPHHRSVFDGSLQVASLDHAIWFHRHFRADEWLLYDEEALSTQGARGLCRGSLFSYDGHLVATVLQEGLIRQKAP